MVDLNFTKPKPKAFTFKIHQTSAWDFSQSTHRIFQLEHPAPALALHPPSPILIHVCISIAHTHIILAHAHIRILAHAHIIILHAHSAHAHIIILHAHSAHAHIIILHAHSAHAHSTCIHAACHIIHLLASKAAHAPVHIGIEPYAVVHSHSHLIIHVCHPRVSWLGHAGVHVIGVAPDNKVVVGGWVHCDCSFVWALLFLGIRSEKFTLEGVRASEVIRSKSKRSYWSAV
jgi:hypothetical protein